ncbi:MAG: response regulator receiver [Anaerolineaceae bacterium]|nr:MAG: response regulator receiver [Anaerolineaceae bacterium]
MNIPYGPLLVVEDVPNVLELLEVTLRFKGYPVISARNGQEALDAIAKERPALVITDILMPKMDGYALAHRLRTDPKTRNIPIIFLSATYLMPEDKDFALSLGAARFIEKPIDTEEFLLTVAELLTEGPDTLPRPLSERDFYTGYRARLEHKLRHKNTQISRTERLLTTLPESQRPAFEALLRQAQNDREEIQTELNEIYQILDELKRPR